MAQKVRTLPKNTKGRDFIVGDIHGCFQTLAKALDALQFDPKVDRLIATGDLVNRGPYSEQSLSYLQKSWFHAVQGNHERFVLDIAANKEYQTDDFREALKEQPIDFGMDWFYDMGDTPLRQEIVSAIQELPVALEIETDDKPIVILHGNIPKGEPTSWEATKKAINEGNEEVIDNVINTSIKLERGNDETVEDVHRIFFGHAVRPQPHCLGNCFYIDTGGVYTIQGTSAEHFITIVEINANKNDICSPTPLKDVPNVRVALGPDSMSAVA